VHRVALVHHQVSGVLPDRLGEGRQHVGEDVRHFDTLWLRRSRGQPHSVLLEPSRTAQARKTSQKRHGRAIESPKTHLSALGRTSILAPSAPLAVMNETWSFSAEGMRKRYLLLPEELLAMMLRLTRTACFVRSTRLSTLVFTKPVSAAGAAAAASPSTQLTVHSANRALAKTRGDARIASTRSECDPRYLGLSTSLHCFHSCGMASLTSSSPTRGVKSSWTMSERLLTPSHPPNVSTNGPSTAMLLP
jgi:hypothetical protein